MRRRELLSLLAGTAALGVTSDGGEEARRDVEKSLPRQVSSRDADEWERSAYAYGTEIGTTPPVSLLRHLLTDLDEINGLQCGQMPSTTQRRLLRVAVQFSALVAVTVVATGAAQAGRRWWRTARRLSRQLDDPELTTFVLAQHAVLAPYSGYGQDHALDLADEAVNTPGGELVCVGAASATAARAQALAALGAADEARQTLDRLRSLVDRLPDDVTAPSATWFGYPEYKLRHVESFVTTRIGRTREAFDAQEAATRLYPPDKYRGLAQIDLHRSTCLIGDGYVDEGIEHASRTLHDLPTSLRQDTLIRSVAQTAVTAIPASTRDSSTARDLRHLLSSIENA